MDKSSRRSILFGAPALAVAASTAPAIANADPRSDTTSPRLEAAIAALQAFEPEYRRAALAHDLAEKATMNLPDHGIDPPAELTVTSPGLVMKFPDREVAVPPTPYTYRSAESIERADDLSPERKGRMLAALDAWERDIVAAQRANGTLALIEAERAAGAVWERALHERDRLGSAVLNAPVHNIADLKRQLIAACAARDVKHPQDLECEEDKDAALAAVMRALRTIQA